MINFINPFSSVDLDKGHLYNAASGKSVQEDVKNCLVTVFERGYGRMQEFTSRLTGDYDKNLFDPIKQEGWKNFEDAKIKVSAKVDGKIKDIAVQKYVVGVLAGKSDQDKSSVDIDKASEYPLALVSLQLVSSVGCM